MRDFTFLGSKITADGDCSHEIKKCLLLGRKAITKLDSVVKSRDITLPTNICLVKAMVFPVVMYGCESQSIKKAERRRIPFGKFGKSLIHECSPLVGEAILKICFNNTKRTVPVLEELMVQF